MVTIKTGRTPRPYRMILYGTEGIGKSTFATWAESPVMIPTEEGCNEIDVPKFDTFKSGLPVCSTWADMCECIWYLRDTENQFATLIIDSIDWWERFISAEIVTLIQKRDPSIKTLADVGYGKGPKQLIPYASDILAMLDELRNMKNMNIILIAHAGTEKVEDPTLASYDQWAPRLDKNINPMFKEWADLICFATRKTRIEETETPAQNFGKSRKIAKEIKGDSGRILITTGKPAVVAKNRYNLPDEMPLDGSAFFPMLENAIWGERNNDV